MLKVEQVREAAARIAPYAHKTPVLTSSALNRFTGARLFFKGEHLQRSGAFKFRGACNAVFSLSESALKNGVVSHSSGNHAAALALAARLRGISAQIVIPHGTTEAKIAAVEREGAKIIRCEDTMEAREEVTAGIAAKTGAEIIHPYNDSRVMAGQGTTALELLEQVPELDYLVIPLSGGGLTSGCATVAKAADPAIRVIAVEPAGADDARRSLAAGEIIKTPVPKTICEGLRAFLGPLTFEVIRERVDEIVDVPDADTIAAMRRLWEILKQVVEPSGAVGLAALLAGKIKLAPDSRIGIILTGGNVDLDQLPWA